MSKARESLDDRIIRLQKVLHAEKKHPDYEYRTVYEKDIDLTTSPWKLNAEYFKQVVEWAKGDSDFFVHDEERMAYVVGDEWPPRIDVMRRKDIGAAVVSTVTGYLEKLERVLDKHRIHPDHEYTEVVNREIANLRSLVIDVGIRWVFEEYTANRQGWRLNEAMDNKGYAIEGDCVTLWLVRDRQPDIVNPT